MDSAIDKAAAARLADQITAQLRERVSARASALAQTIAGELGTRHHCSLGPDEAATISRIVRSAMMVTDDDRAALAASLLLEHVVVTTRAPAPIVGIDPAPDGNLDVTVDGRSYLRILADGITIDDVDGALVVRAILPMPPAPSEGEISAIEDLLGEADPAAETVELERDPDL